MATDSKAKPNAKEVVALTSLAQLKPDTVKVLIDVGDGKTEIAVELQSVSYARWEALADEIPQVEPEMVGVGADKAPIYDRQSQAYQAKMADRAEEVMFNRLLEMLPATLEIPGATRAERRQALREMDRNFTTQLINAMVQISAGGRTRVEQRSRTFPGV